MSDTQAIQWSSTKIANEKYQYTTITHLDQESALQLQGMIIEALGEANEGYTDNHKKFACTAGVVGVDKGGRQYRVDLVASQEQFSSVFPNAIMVASPNTASRAG